MRLEALGQVPIWPNRTGPHLIWP